MTGWRTGGHRRALVAAVALAAAVSGTAQAAGQMPPGAVKYEWTYTGLVYVKYSHSGSQANANCPQLSDDQTPYSETDTVKVAWTTVFSYSGTLDDPNTCSPLKFGAQGRCTGTLRNHASGLMILRLTRARANDDFKLNIQPFGPLGASPSSCMDNDSPPGAHAMSVQVGVLSDTDTCTTTTGAAILDIKLLGD